MSGDPAGRMTTRRHGQPPSTLRIIICTEVAGSASKIAPAISQNACKSRRLRPSRPRAPPLPDFRDESRELLPPRVDENKERPEVRIIRCGYRTRPEWLFAIANPVRIPSNPAAFGSCFPIPANGDTHPEDSPGNPSNHAERVRSPRCWIR